MNRRSILTVLACLVFALSVGAMLHGRQRIHELRQPSTPPVQVEPLAAQDAPPASPAQGGVPLDLLRLRAEVTRLTARRDELAASASRAPAMAASPGGMPTSIVPLPPGYVRKSKAAFVGYSSPENSLQSFLWAVHNKDVDRLTQAFTPEAAQRFKTMIEQMGSEEFFKQAENLPGMAIKEQKELEDGLMELQVEIIPGIPDAPSSAFKMKRVSGEWKIASPF